MKTRHWMKKYKCAIEAYREYLNGEGFWYPNKKEFIKEYKDEIESWYNN